MRKYTRALVGIGLGISGLFLTVFPVEKNGFFPQRIVPNILSARAEEDDSGEERERDNDHASSSGQSQTSISSVQTQTITRYEVRSVTKVVDVTPAEYLIDTDGDGLVDAVDPHPTVPESEFWTDTDRDSIPNAYDLHHDEDDFTYFEGTDVNHDGILDMYEPGVAVSLDNPLVGIKDTDADGISDDAEVSVYHTDPLTYDTDGDGVGDGSEVLDGTNPLDSKRSVLTDGDKGTAGMLEGNSPLWYFGLSGNIVAVAFVALGTLGRIVGRKSDPDSTSETA